MQLEARHCSGNALTSGRGGGALARATSRWRRRRARMGQLLFVSEDKFDTSTVALLRCRFVYRTQIRNKSLPGCSN